MIDIIPDGVWPTMLTPFTVDDKVDFEVLEKMVKWYIQNGVAGLFSVCLSSEVFYLSMNERLDIARFVIKETGGKIPVIASGSTADSISEQIDEIIQIAETGVEAVVILTNRLAPEESSEDVWKKNLERLLSELPQEIQLGLYECPYPYKRLLSPDLLKFCSSTGKFLFLKDTSCDLELIKKKIEAVKGESLKVFNANAATLLYSLKYGAAGYSSVMANFHPDLYVWLCKRYQKDPEKARVVSDFLGAGSLAERQLYPVNAKYHMQLQGINIDLHTRCVDDACFTQNLALEIKQLFRVTQMFRAWLNGK